MKIIIQGDFYDCQFIRNRFFLWDTYGWLSVMDVRAEIQDIINNHGWQFEYTINKAVVNKLMVASLRLKGGIFPLDSAYMGNHLYTATETGLYRRYLQNGTRIVELSQGLAKKLIDVRFVELAAQSNIMAMAGLSEGVFELYNPRVYRITKSGHQPKEVEKGIYSVIRTSSKSVWYENNNIGSVSNEGLPFLCRYRTKVQPGEDGRILRTYVRQEEQPQKWVPRLQDKSHQQHNQAIVPEISGDTSQMVFVHEIEDLNHTVNYCFCTSSHRDHIKLNGKPRRFLHGSFGLAAETKRELIIVRNDNKIVRVEGPITRARVVSGFGKKDNLLVVVCSDHVMITDCNDE